jgi:hypothetical protein
MKSETAVTRSSQFHRELALREREKDRERRKQVGNFPVIYMCIVYIAAEISPVDCMKQAGRRQDVRRQ